MRKATSVAVLTAVFGWLEPGTASGQRPALATEPLRLPPTTLSLPAAGPPDPLRGVMPNYRSAQRPGATLLAPDFALLPFWPVDSSVFRPYAGLKAASISPADLPLLRELLLRVQQENQLDCTAHYWHQCIGATDDRGQQLVWVNGFYRAPGDYWKQQIYEVKGGGNCFYRVLLNLSSRQYTRFGINAPK